MVRKLIVPSERNVLIEIPQNYVGKEIEVLLYAVEELEKKEIKNTNASAFRGIFSKDEGVEFNKYLEQARNEWERNI